MKYIGIPMDILEKMPVRDRRAYISIHNKKIDEENAKMEGNNSTTIDGEMMNKYTDMSQMNMINENKR